MPKESELVDSLRRDMPVADVAACARAVARTYADAFGSIDVFSLRAVT